MSEKTKTSGVINSNFELKFQKQNLYFAFFKTILIHIDSTSKYTHSNDKCKSPYTIKFFFQKDVERTHILKVLRLANFCERQIALSLEVIIN